MNTSTHPVAPEEVMAFLDGELSPDQAQVVSAHVEQCEECAEVMAALRSASKDLSAWIVEPAPERVANRVAVLASKLRFGVDIEHSNLFVRLRFWSWGQWAIAASATGVVFLVIVAISIPNYMRSRAHMAAHEQITENDKQIVALATESKRPSPPVNGRNLNSVVTLTERGVATDSNGLTNGLGDHYDSSVSVDGQPRADQRGKVFGDEITAPMIARAVSLSLIVKDFATSRANLDAILARHHGYVAELSANTTVNAPRLLDASLRVPAPELDTAIADLKTLGRVEKETRSGEEVTQQHADLVARLKNSRQTEQRLQAILEQRTGKISDVLAVEQEIARVRGEIEQMEAEQTSLEHRVDFATVNLNLMEEYKAQFVPPAISAGTRLHNALVEGYRSASETLLGIVLFFAEYTLTLLIWGMILVLPALLLWRRYRRSLATV